MGVIDDSYHLVVHGADVLLELGRRFGVHRFLAAARYSGTPVPRLRPPRRSPSPVSTGFVHPPVCCRHRWPVQHPDEPTARQPSVSSSLSRPPPGLRSRRSRPEPPSVSHPSRRRRGGRRRWTSAVPVPRAGTVRCLFRVAPCLALLQRPTASKRFRGAVEGPRELGDQASLSEHRR